MLHDRVFSYLKEKLRSKLRSFLGVVDDSCILPRTHPSVHHLAVIHPSAQILLTGHSANRVAVGAHTHLRGELFLFGHGGRILIGEQCYIGEGTRLWSGCSIKVGNRVLISHSCTIVDNLTHPEDPDERNRHFQEIVTLGHPAEMDLGELPVVIEDDAWVCSHCVILRGVRIGRGAIVAAGSVVTSSVPQYTIVAGNPARAIRAVKRKEPC